MVLSFLKKHKKFLKSTKNSTENGKVFNIYPHSVHIPKFCTETCIKSTFANYPSVGSPDLKNGRRRKKNRHSWRFLLFPFLAFGFLLQNFVFPATTSTIFRSSCLPTLTTSFYACYLLARLFLYFFCVKIVPFLAIFARFRNN